MNEFIKAVRIAVIALCAALFAVGIIWNLCYGTLPEEKTAAALGSTEVWEQQYSAEQTQAVETGLFTGAEAEQTERKAGAEALENRLAALRIQRDDGWEQLQAHLAALEFDDKQQCLKQYELLQYQEQRLELLLGAKGIARCLVLLDEEQANVIVEAEQLADQYEKIYDLVQRNTDYQPEQIVLIPLEGKTEAAEDGA